MTAWRVGIGGGDGGGGPGEVGLRRRERSGVSGTRHPLAAVGTAFPRRYESPL